jgi:hypothetical protein
MHALIFLRVDWMKNLFFILDWDAENLGAGNVERNTVDNIMTLTQDKNFLQQKTTMMPFVVEKKKTLRKMNIVEEDVQGIVLGVGKINHCLYLCHPWYWLNQVEGEIVEQQVLLINFVCVYLHFYIFS